MKRFLLSALAALSLFVQADYSQAQTANGKATTAAPTYTNNSAQPLSLDLSGGLRVNCASGCAGAGNSLAQATTAAPSYVNATSNPLSMDLSGNLRTSILTALPTGANIIGGVTVQGTLPAGSAIIGKVGIDQTTPGTTNGVQVNAALPAGANSIGNIGTVSTVSTVTAVTAITNALPTGANNIGSVIPSATSGTSNFSAIMAATTNATSVKASAGVVTEITVYNSSATLAWLKLYNSASAPTCGSGTPVGRYLIPGTASGGAGSNVEIGLGKAFTTGIAFCVTGLLADADTTATAAGTMAVNLTFK